MAEPAIAPASPAPAAPPAPAPAPTPRSAAPAPAVLSDVAYEALSESERGRWARTRIPGEQGGSRWTLRSDLQPDGTPKPAQAPSDAPPAATVTPDGKLRIGEGETAFELDGSDVAEILRTRAEMDLRASKVPADGYQPTLPADFVAKVPAGIELREINTTDLAYVELAAFAKSHALTQEQFSAILSIDAARQIREIQAFKAASEAEVQKLGVTGTSRISSLETWLRGMIGDDLAGAVRGMIVTEKIVRGLEMLSAKWTSQGAAPFSQAHRATPEPQGRVTDEQWAKMSHGERIAYARQHDQRAFQGSGR
jgi:hypothetical protein